MTQKQYRRLVEEYERKATSRADRRWEAPLRERIESVIRRGLADEAKWAQQAAADWRISGVVVGGTDATH